MEVWKYSTVLTSTAVAISILSNWPPRVVLKPQQFPDLFTATEKTLEAHACSLPVASKIKLDPTCEKNESWIE